MLLACIDNEGCVQYMSLTLYRQEMRNVMCVELLAYVDSEGCVQYISLQWTGTS